MVVAVSIVSQSGVCVCTHVYTASLLHHCSGCMVYDFNDSIRSLVASKREEVIRALSGRGLYRLGPQYAHLGVNHMTWQRKRSDQHKKLVQHFDECSLLSESINNPSTPPPKPHSGVNPANEQCSSSSDPAGGTCHINISIHSPSKQSDAHTESSSLSGSAMSMSHISF